MTLSSLNTSITVRLKVAVYLMALLSIAAFAYMEGSPAFFLLGCAACLASWLIVESPRGRPVPQWILNIVVLAAAAYFWHEETTWFSQGLVIALGHFMIALILCKLFESKGTRDLAQTSILSLLLIVASAMMFASNIPFALILAAFLGVLVYAIVLINLRYEMERHAADASMALVLPAARHAVRLGQDVRRLTWQTWAFLIPLAAVIFVAIPRPQSGFLNNLGSGENLQTGYNDLVQFHEFGELTESNVVMMTVKLTRHSNGDNLGSEILQPYFRGAALDSYDGVARQWYASREMQQTYGEVGIRGRWVELRAPNPVSEFSLIDQEYTIIDTKHNPTMFTLAPNPPASVYLYDVQGPNSLRFSPQDLGVRLGGSPTRMLHYSVSSLALPDASMYIGKGSVKPGDMGQQTVGIAPATATSTQPATQAATGAAGGPATQRAGTTAGNASTEPAAVIRRGTYRRQPFIIPDEIRDLARRKAGLDLLQANVNEPPAPDNILMIKGRFENFLRMTYPYALNSRQVEKGMDPTVDFLLHRQAIGGNCEYFASAMVMLCRAVGINARPVVGYVGAEFNNVTMEYVVRGKDAHMWAEVYVPSAGWVLSDPSPTRMILGASSWPVKKWAQDMARALDNFWLSWVVTFDNESRAALLASVGAVFSVVYNSVATEVLAFKVGLSGEAGFWQRWAILLFLVGMLGLVGWAVRRVRQDGTLLVLGAPGGRRFGKLSGDHAFMDELFRLVSQDGEVRRTDLTPREFAQEHRERLGEYVSDAQWLVDTYYSLRFGMRKVDANLRHQIAGVLGRVRVGLEKAASEAS